jgi:diguanylate cyclase
MTSLAKISPPLPVILMTMCAAVIGAIFFLAPELGGNTVDTIVSIIARAQKWEQLQIEPSGLVVRNVYNLFPIATLLALTFLCFVAVAAGALRVWAAIEHTSTGAKSPPSEKVVAAGFKLENELIAILQVLRSQFGSNESYSKSLTQAQNSLTTITKPDQVQAVVKFLMTENEKMQRESSELKGKLEQSQAQIENLRSDLSAAEAEGMRDPLTSVGNRRCFDATLAKEAGEAHERKKPMCLIMGDIDNFKKVNDSHGHLIGDDILKMFARLLSDNVKGRDTVTRFGGEEFAIILPETHIAAAENLAERIRAQFEAKRLTNNTNGEKLGKITASFGVAQLRDGDSPDMLVQRADAKLYEAKCAGRNRVAVYGKVTE